MTSVLRTLDVKKEGLTLFVKPNSPRYNKGSDIYVLFPFSYSNQVLDITYEGNNFQSIMVDVPGQPPNEDGGDTSTTIRIISGAYLATSLGENFKEYIRSWRSSTIDADSPIEMYIAPQLLRVQQASFANISSTSSANWKISTSIPASENYISGDATNNFDTTYIFKTPLTFTIMESGVKKYVTFKTALDQE